MLSGKLRKNASQKKKAAHEGPLFPFRLSSGGGCEHPTWPKAHGRDRSVYNVQVNIWLTGTERKLHARRDFPPKL